MAACTQHAIELEGQIPECPVRPITDASFGLDRSGGSLTGQRSISYVSAELVRLGCRRSGAQM